MLVAFPKQESSQPASLSWLPQWNSTEKRDLGLVLWSLCSFSEPSILFHLTFILEIRDEGYDSYLWHILEHCFIPGITRPESRRTAKGSTSPTAPKQFFLEYTAASTQPVRRAWKGQGQRGDQHGSPAATHCLLHTTTCSDRCCCLPVCRGGDPNNIQPLSHRGADQLGVTHQHSIRNIHY